MRDEGYRCPKCGSAHLSMSSTVWRCIACDEIFQCVSGVPRLYIEDRLGGRDVFLRDFLYNGLYGKLYSFMSPFLVLPVRPLNIAWPYWIVYFAALTLCLGPIGLLIDLLLVGTGAWAATLFVLTALAGVLLFFWRHHYLFNLLLLAIPTKISLLFSKFRPAETFSNLHARIIEQLKQLPEKLTILDVATGNCSSLYRHGWMKLNAEFAGIDLSETMLMQGLDFMSDKQIPVDLVLGDACELPFQTGMFDVVLNYGALNSLTDPARALAEMSRVTKPGGLVLFLDEQIYTGASQLEQWYFRKVLSAHNVIDHCPVELLPPDLIDIEVIQVYHFYYICIAHKAQVERRDH